MPRRAHKAPRARLSPFGIALILSTLLHLSMVTLFNVVIYFPRQDIVFYQFQIREVTPAHGTSPTSEGQLRGPSLDDAALAEALKASNTVPAPDVLPRIQLPTIEFAELSRLRVGRTTGLDYGALLDNEPTDSWARFSGGLRKLGQSLTSLALPGEDGAPESPGQTVEPRPTHRPAEGFEAWIDWSIAPLDRELLYAPPIKALWESTPETLTGTIEVVIEVNPLGRVVSVFSPGVDPGGVTDAVQLGVLKYRFAPIQGAGAPERQLGTVRIRRVGGGT